MKKKFSLKDIDLLNRGQEIRSEDIAAVLGRSVNSVRVKLSKMGKVFNSDVLERNQSLSNITVKSEDGKFFVTIGEIKGILKIIFI